MRLRLLPPVDVAETQEEAIPVLEYLMNRGGSLALDTETTGLSKLGARVLYWSMATEDRRFFFPARILGCFNPLFRRKDITWRLANAKFDMHMLMNMGYELSGDIWDIIVMDAMIDDTRPHGLKDQAWLAYEAKWGEFKELFLDPYTVSSELGLDKSAFTQFKQDLNGGEKLEFVYEQAPNLVEDYATCDAYFTYMRAEDLATQLSLEELPTDMVPEMRTLYDYYNIIEVPTTRALFGMERAGIDVDQDWVKKIDGPIRDGIAAKEEKLKKLIGKQNLNVKSNEELGAILFGKDNFNLKPVKYTAGGKSEPKPSVDENTLKILSGRCKSQSLQADFINTLLSYRKLIKIHGTYVKGLRWDPDPSRYPKTVVGPDGRVHCSFNQSGARTSRLSSSDPNMQNIPIRNDEYQVRGCFVASPGTKLVDLDYPQIEFRIAAALAGEQGMIEAICKGWDIHSANAANMYKADARVTYEAIMNARQRKDAKEALTDLHKMLLSKRDGAKTVGLGALYGEGKNKMAHSLGISVDDAEDIINTFFSANPKIKGLIEYSHRFAHNHEYTHTMLGRMRRLYRINNTYSTGLVAAEERQAFNTLIQGSGAEMMKLAMIRIDNSKEFKELGGQLILTVHDELIARAPSDTAHEVETIMRSLMAEPYRWGPIQLKYPVPVDPDGAVGDRWSEIH